jgi:hypothetical protein
VDSYKSPQGETGKVESRLLAAAQVRISTVEIMSCKEILELTVTSGGRLINVETCGGSGWKRNWVDI